MCGSIIKYMEIYGCHPTLLENKIEQPTGVFLSFFATIKVAKCESEDISFTDGKYTCLGRPRFAQTIKNLFYSIFYFGCPTSENQESSYSSFMITSCLSKYVKEMDAHEKSSLENNSI